MKTCTVKFLVNQEQLDKIKSNAHVKGHKTISSYMRQLALEKDLQRELWLEKILLDIHRSVTQNAAGN